VLLKSLAQFHGAFDVDGHNLIEGVIVHLAEELILDTATELEDDLLVADVPEQEPPEIPATETVPALEMTTAMDVLQRLQDSGNYSGLPLVMEHTEKAQRILKAGSNDDSLGYLKNLSQELESAVQGLGQVTPLDRSVTRQQERLVNAGSVIVGSLIERLEESDPSSSVYLEVLQLHKLGLSALADGRYEFAAGLIDDAMGLASNSLRFDIVRFRQNVIGELGSKSVGWALAISYLGQLYNGGDAFGQARTSADSPSTPQTINKRMQVASVSKPLTSIVTLHLLDGLGLNPNTQIAPYLPSDWVQGPGVDELEFRHFLTHRSGVGQAKPGSKYEDLQVFIENGPGPGFNPQFPPSFDYDNSNFGMMRILIPGLMGIDLSAFEPDFQGIIASSAFLSYSRLVYEQIGINELSCESHDDQPTVQYNFPDNNDSGYLEPSRNHNCGGFGWFISARELASVMTHLRNTEDLLSATARNWMQENHLGFGNPVNRGYASGAYGNYYGHGGDWFHGAGEAHTCVLAFPIRLEVGLVINSEYHSSMPYQCDLLKEAFENAWVL